MPRQRSAGTPENEVTFEQAMSELEEIVHVLEDGTLPLDGLVEKYERGSSLLRLCQERLHSAQQRIEMIRQRADGTQEVAPFAAESSAPATPRPARKISSPDHAPSDEIRLF